LERFSHPMWWGGLGALAALPSPHLGGGGEGGVVIGKRNIYTTTARACVFDFVFVFRVRTMRVESDDVMLCRAMRCDAMRCDAPRPRAARR